MSQPDLVVNCRFLTRPVTGVERFAFEIVARLVERVDDIRLVAPPTIPAETRIAGQRVQPVGRLRGHLWEQVSLPRYLRSVGSPTLLDLANTGPLLWPNQLYVLHDVAFITQPESYRRAFRLAYRVIAGTLVRRASHVATVSTFSRDEIVRVFRCLRCHIEIVPNGVSTFVSSPAPSRPLELGVVSTSWRSALRPVTRTPRGWWMRMRASGNSGRSALPSDRRRKCTRVPFAECRRRSAGVVELGRVSDRQLAQLYRTRRHSCIRRYTKVSASRPSRHRPRAHRS